MIGNPYNHQLGYFSCPNECGDQARSEAECEFTVRNVQDRVPLVGIAITKREPDPDLKSLVHAVRMENPLLRVEQPKTRIWFLRHGLALPFVIVAVKLAILDLTDFPAPLRSL
jgi:hypothetical protein